ncbi:MAG: TolC family protein [Bacteroidota bacterium]
MFHKICGFFLVVTLATSVNAQEIRLGIVTDFNKTERLDSVFSIMANQIDQTTGAGVKASLNNSDIIYDNTSLEQARASYDQIVSKVDFVLLIGAVSVKGAAFGGSFSKPTIGLGVDDPNLQQIPFQDGKSGTPNFSYIWAEEDFSYELTQFKRLFDFRNLSILVDASSAITYDLSKAQATIDSLSESFSIAINIIPMTDNVNASLAAMPDNTDAVYLSTFYSKDEDFIREVSNELIQRELPSFSGTKSHVDNGILSCVSDENGLVQVIRKLSLMVDDVQRGASLEDMPVSVNYKKDFFLNLSTAKKIDFSPPFEILFTSNLISGEAEELPTYSFEEIAQRALEENFDIKISYKNIDLAEQSIRQARSFILPSAELAVNGTQIDPDQAIPGISPERQLSGSVNFSQLLFSEQAIAAIKIAQIQKELQEYTTEADILQVLINTYAAYFQVLVGKTNLKIQQENLSNSQVNLELARLRNDIGTANETDVFRFESEVAAAQQFVVQAQTSLLTAKLQLNTFLANTLEEEFEIQDITIDGEVYEDFRNGPIDDFVQTPKEFGQAIDFLVSESVNSNPNKELLLENIKAIDRQLAQDKRLIYAPQVALQGQVSQIFGRGGTGSTETPGTPFNDNLWQVGFSITHPLFLGNSRRINVQQSTIQLEQLEEQRKSLDQQLELAVRSNALQALNTTTNINFSKISSENAQRNFELIQENYEAGDVTITQLIDAQRAALEANLNYAISVYDYMIAQLQLEFSVGFFTQFATAEELTDFEDRFRQFTGEN